MRKDSFDEIYRSYFNEINCYLISLCLDHHLAEDILQETFFRAYLYFEDCESENIRAWLYKVAYNAFIDFTRKQKKVAIKDDAFFKELPGGNTPEDKLIRKEKWTRVALHIASLPEKQKQAILLHDFSGLSYQDAADIMEVTLGYYKILIYRARQAIRSEGKG